MRRIDEVKRRKIKNVDSVQILDKKRMEITFTNGASIIVGAASTDYGYDAVIYIEKEAHE